MKYIKLFFIILFILILLVISIYIKKDKINLDVNINHDKVEVNFTKRINNLRQEYNNNDIIGILKINKVLEVPVLQTNDNDYYLNHTINNKESIYGAIFMDYRINVDNSKKILIYGHSSTSANIDFNILEKYYEKEYYDKHKYITLTTDKENKIYEIFSVYVETTDFSYMNISFINEENYYDHISNLKIKSLYDTDIELKKDDEILILQTCSNHNDYLNYDKRYLLIISRRIK